MNILLVNDDGIDSGLLDFARKVLAEYGTVHTIAPKVQQSGKSMAISMRDIPYNRIDDNTHEIEGTPADCVSFGLYGLGLAPDFVVSGINKGYNLGMDTKYSGTVGAALQASYHGKPAIAFSSDHRGDRLVKNSFKMVMDHILAEDMLSAEYVLNVNFPLDEFVEPEGIKPTELYYLRYDYDVKMQQGLFRKKRKRLSDDLPEDSDIRAVRAGYVSISKLSLENDC